MKRLALALALAFPLTAQPHCTEFGWRGWPNEPYPFFRHHSLFVWGHFAGPLQFLPVAGTVAMVAPFWHPSYSFYYQDPFIRTNNTEPAGCDDGMRWRSIAIWWDDRRNEPQPGDQLGVYASHLAPRIDLVRYPTGWVIAGSIPLAMEPGILRAEGRNPPHWNRPLWRPEMWAVAIVPERGWW